MYGFSALEDRVNFGVMAKMANAVAAINGVDYPVVFRNGYAEAISGLASGSAPSVALLAAGAPALYVGQALAIADVNYAIASIEPDGTGWITLQLRKA